MTAAEPLHMQSAYLVEALKRVLKERGLTYADVASALGISHASVRRTFAQQSFTLARIDEICEIAGIDFLALARMADEMRPAMPAMLTDAQEQALVDEPLALFCFHLALGGWTVERIEADYGIDQTQLIPALLKLERIGLIQLLPGNIIRLMTARSIGWRRGGPMRRFFDRRVKEEFLLYDFSTPGSIWEFEIGELSEASRALLERRLASLFREVRDLIARDAPLPPAVKTNVGLLIASTPIPLPMVARDVGSGSLGTDKRVKRSSKD
ncbi:helix-turn-helix transcriptional regulator [Sphingopyxis sp. SE2]|jgi:transcriptional regulator with XRE-family HTH domain|uniref:helix-turn-helix domain-containing protein n=1 Tax=Sphingopyxis sp. SE2 TaxID=1586240 RepID=UPI0028C1516F|nr:helix-turn-helix transcriptional regulator [Sphingopyxis sp. SE2]MDT7527064.1 helix-turn-helix transcriptional regulator [Sphingopyxis sp. SE2]